MKITNLKADWQRELIPNHQPDMIYECIGCGQTYPLNQFLYTCPSCKNLLKLRDLKFDQLKKHTGETWRRIFDQRRLLNLPALKGIFLFHELILPVVPLNDVIYLGEGHTPIVKTNEQLSTQVGMEFFIKYDGLNPSAS